MVSVWFSDWVVADRYVVDSRVRFVAWLGGGSLFLSRFGVACFCFFLGLIGCLAYFAVVCDCGFLPSPGLRGLCVGVGVLGTVGLVAHFRGFGLVVVVCGLGCCLWVFVGFGLGWFPAYF